MRQRYYQHQQCPHHIDIADSLEAIGEIHRTNSDFHRAEVYYQQAMIERVACFSTSSPQQRRQPLVPTYTYPHPSMAVTVQRIATLRYAQGHFEAARVLFEGDPPHASLDIYPKIYPKK